jgi:LPS export ABC transporter protein LptC
MIRQIFFVSVSLLMLGWFLIVWDSPPESFLQQKNKKIFTQDSIESFMTNSETQIYSNNGEKMLTLKATKLESLEGEKILTLYEPRAIGSNQNESFEISSFSLSSEKGTFDPEKGDLKLFNSVEGILQTTAGQRNLSSSSINYNIPTMALSSQSRFNLQEKNHEITGEKFLIDLKNNNTILFSKISATYYAD